MPDVVRLIACDRRYAGAACLALLALLPASAFAWQTGGDVRAGYFASERSDRDGSQSSADEWQLRVRTSLQTTPDDSHGFSARLRAAGRFSSRQDGSVRFRLRAWSPGGEGLLPGEATFDEAWLQYRARRGDWRVRLGRFQTDWKLDGVAGKSLDRNDSSSVSVNWTDGVHVTRAPVGGWQAHLIVDYNDRRGGTTPRREPPLEFADRASRAGFYTVLANRDRLGPLVQREVSVTWLPSTLPEGDPVADYMSLVARTSARWPVGETGMRFQSGAEGGYAPSTPDDADGMRERVAWQVSANVLDFRPRHSLGVVYGEAGAGWLVSPDFRPNNTLLEARYRWQLAEAWRFEARLRRRQDLERPSGEQRRVDDDLYVRLTWRY